MLELLSEEPIGEDRLEDYFGHLYRIVCVGERPGTPEEPGELVRTTYIVDWEQLVHLLEDYRCFGEDIVEVSAVPLDSAPELRASMLGLVGMARA